MELKTCTVKMSNLEMRQRVESLQPILAQRNLIGYLAAYNVRVLSNALTEYNDLEKEAILKFGIDELDENGTPLGTKSIKMGSESYDAFIKFLSPYMGITQEVSIAVADCSETVGVLSGEELLAIDWMLDGGGMLWPR